MLEDPLIDFANVTLRVARKLRSYPVNDPDITTITPLECMVLLQVQRSPGCAPTDITRELGLRSSNTSSAIRSLVKKDQLTREVDPDDRRSAHLFLTEHATTSLETLNRMWQQQLAAVEIDEAQWLALLKLMTSVDDSLRESS